VVCKTLQRKLKNSTKNRGWTGSTSWYLRHYEHRLLCWETCCCYIVCIFFILWYPHTCDNSNTIVCRGLCWYYIAFW
jgi:hypothetical protein